jgi:hypothetical protein
MVQRLSHYALVLYVTIALGLVLPAHHHLQHFPEKNHHAHSNVSRDVEYGKYSDRHELAWNFEKHHSDADHADNESNPSGSGTHDPFHCSICLFAQTLSVISSFTVNIPTLDVVTIRPEDAPTPIIDSSIALTLFGRAPPLPA